MQDGDKGFDYYADDIRARLVRLGVEVNFWTQRFFEPEEEAGLSLMESESDPDNSREAKRNLGRLLIDTAERAGLDAVDWGDGEEGQRISGLLEGKVPEDVARAITPSLAILAADELVRAGREDKAAAIYQQAVELAPTTQSQLEVGYLLAMRARVAFPVQSPHWEQQPMLLTPDHEYGWYFPESFPGLDHYQVIFEELLPGPELRDSTPALRLALEAYGRVFFRCFPPGRRPASWLGLARPWMSFDQLVIDGVYVLLSALEGHDETLVNACLHTLWDWSGGHHLTWVEDRLRIANIYMQARREGREDAEAVQQGVEIARKTIVLTDPDEFASSMVEKFRAEVGAMSIRARTDLEEFFRKRFPGWSKFPGGVREALLLGEREFREKGTSKGDDFAGPIMYYGRAVEAALKSVTESHRASVGEFSRGDSAKSLLRARLMPAAPLDWLVSALGDIAETTRNPAAHGAVEHRFFSESECDRCRTKVLEAIECLMKYRRRERGG